GQPGNLESCSRYRKPIWKSRRRTIHSAFVFRERIKLIRAVRWAAVSVSATSKTYLIGLNVRTQLVYYTRECGLADNLGKASWSWRCVSALDQNGEQPGSLTHTAQRRRDDLSVPSNFVSVRRTHDAMDPSTGFGYAVRLIG